jgi:hypothetical protein
MSYTQELHEALRELPSSWPLMVISTSGVIREKVSPSTNGDGELTSDCPYCMRTSTIRFKDMQTRRPTFTCDAEACEKHGAQYSLLHFLQIAGSFSSEAETMEHVLITMGHEPPELKVEEANVIDAAMHFSKTKESSYIKLPPPDKQNIYEAIWSYLHLREEDRQELRAKRGFVRDGWIDDCGLRSSVPDNARFCADIINRFPEKKLLESGAFTISKRTGKIELAPSLRGMGMKKDGDAMVPSFDVMPVIIPYIDIHGRIVNLRPHKVNLSNTEFLEKENIRYYHRDKHQLVMPYGECFLDNTENSAEYTLVICEGEFKAIALNMCGIRAIAFPGIHSLRNEQFLKEVLRIIQLRDIRHIIVAFDSEDKSNKEFAKRFEAKIYAYYTAYKLEMYQLNTRVLMLPEEWRIDGKADWDGILSKVIKESKSESAGVTKAIRLFKETIAKTPPLDRQGQFAYTPEHKIIAYNLNKLLYEPNIFIGGKQNEDKIAAEIERWFPEEYASVWLNPKKIAQELRNCIGGYYIYKAPTDKAVEKLSDPDTGLKARILEQIEKLGDEDDTDKVRIRRRQLYCVLTAINIVLFKFPRPICDFTIRSNYKVMQPDNTMKRLIRCYDRHGRKSRHTYLMSAADISTATHFRDFIGQYGDYHWHAGQDQVDFLFKYIDIENYQRVITEIRTLGWIKDHSMWILGDCAVMKNGRIVFPNDDGIIWSGDDGYTYPENFQTAFAHKPPFLFPNMDKGVAKDWLQAAEADNWQSEKKDVSAIFLKALHLINNSYGADYSGYVHVGILMSYLAHPELLTSRYGGTPSFWVQGEKGSGKTQTTRFSMMLAGFPYDYGYQTISGTKVGMERLLTQFSCLPMHFDEWRNKEANESIVALLRNCFMRQTSSKGTRDDSNIATRQVKPNTVPIITGEDATVDAACQSRFAQLTMSFNKRMAFNPDCAKEFKELENQSVEFYRVARYLYRHREEYVKNFFLTLDMIINEKFMTDALPDDRARLVYGSSIASITSLYILLGIKPVNGLTDLAQKMITLAKMEVGNAETDIFRNKFLSTCVNMIQRGSRPMAQKFFRAMRTAFDKDGYISSVRSHGAAHIWIAPAELHSEYLEECRSINSKPDMELNNIRRELQKQPYWVKNENKPHSWKKKFDDDSTARTWWLLDVSRMNATERDIFSPLLAEFNDELEPVDGAPDVSF